MRYRQMRAIVDRIGEWDGRFNGLDAMKDTAGRWSVTLHDVARARLLPIGDDAEFARLAPYFLHAPFAPPLRYVGAPDAALAWSDVLGFIRHVERRYPHWQLGAIVHGSAARYEVLALDARRAGGAYIIRTLGQADALLGRGA